MDTVTAMLDEQPTEDSAALPAAPPRRHDRLAIVVVALLTLISAVFVGVERSGFETAGDETKTPYQPGPGLPGTEVSLLPRGQVVAVTLAGGERAFVVHHRNGGTTAIDAFYGTVPVSTEIGWCQARRTFENLVTRARWDEFGAALTGGRALRTFDTEALADQPDRIVVASLSRPGPGQSSRPQPDPCVVSPQGERLAGLLFPDFPEPRGADVTVATSGSVQPGAYVFRGTATPATTIVTLCSAEPPSDCQHVRYATPARDTSPSTLFGPLLLVLTRTSDGEVLVARVVRLPQTRQR